MSDDHGPVGNWGRWGEQDERGAANLLTPEVVLAAAGQVRLGAVLGLGMPIKGSTAGTGALTVPHLPGRPLPQHFMSVDGGDYAAGARKIKGEMSVADDALVAVAARHDHAHRRPRAHVARRRPVQRAPGRAGCAATALPVAASTNSAPSSPAVYSWTSPAIWACRSCRRRPGSTATCWPPPPAPRASPRRPGDVVLVRTGWSTVFAQDPVRYQDEQPGLNHDGARWLVDRDVVAIGSDNSAVGALDPGCVFAGTVDEDVHLLTLWRSGVYLIELLWLEELAAAVAGGATFLFIAAPLRIDGGTASPVNPVAVL